ncbi:MAG: winged helix-turn-helix domain-containing protein [Aquificaceae bacterium]
MLHVSKAFIIEYKSRRAKMNKENVSEAFKLLLEEIQEVIQALRQKAESALGVPDYPQARVYIGKAEGVEKFKEKVIALQREWENSYAPRLSEEENTEIRMEETQQTRRRVGYTREKEYIIPILESLVEMGGRGRAEEVLRRVEEKMKGRLTEADYETLPISGIIRWVKFANWCRYRLVRRGLLSDSSPRGVWEITEMGRKYLETYKNRR